MKNSVCGFIKSPEMRWWAVTDSIKTDLFDVEGAEA